jgi:hypothetical protein
LRHGGTLALNRDLEQVVEPQHGLQKAQHDEVTEIFDGKKIGHGRSLMCFRRQS